jgi:hypothetical protein
MKIWSWLKAKWSNATAFRTFDYDLALRNVRALEMAKWKGAEPLLTSHERDQIARWRGRLG